MVPFAAAYGKTAGMISGVDLLNGIAGLAGIECFRFSGVTDGPDNDYAAQGEAALAVLAEKDVVFVHVEAPDAEGHDGNAAGKKAAIEAIDREIISRLVAHAAERPLRILALPDHPTPVEHKRHTSEPVPFVLSGPGVTRGTADVERGTAAVTRGAADVARGTVLSCHTGDKGEPSLLSHRAGDGGSGAARLTEAAAAASGIVVDPGHQLMERLLAE
jgi:2,3-diphosphopglycerate-independent phosphoglycerate mutase